MSSTLKLPQNVVPVTGFSLGYPAEDPAPRDRLPLDGLVHYETYQDYDDARVKQVYADRERAGWERYMAIPRLRAMVEEAGVENLAQVYTAVKYTRESHQEYARRVLQYLHEQDFMHN